jgi:hypothetical protein
VDHCLANSSITTLAIFQIISGYGFRDCPIFAVGFLAHCRRFLAVTARTSFLVAGAGIEPASQWLMRPRALPTVFPRHSGIPYGARTHLTTLKGWRPHPKSNGTKTGAHSHVSNGRPPDYKTGALPTELCGQKNSIVNTIRPKGFEPPLFLPTHALGLCKAYCAPRLLVQTNTPGFRVTRVASLVSRSCPLLNPFRLYAKTAN